MLAPPGNTAGGLGIFSPAPGQGRLRAVPVVASYAPAPRILVVEDDEPLARLLANGLAAESFLVQLTHDGEAAEQALAIGQYDLIILDLNLPKMDGLTLLQRLRATQSLVPVLVLTGRSRTEDMVQTLDQGADDYLLKPFSLLEFMARVRVLLRRSATPAPGAPKTTGLILDRSEFRVERNGRQISLTPREFAVLEFLVLHTGKPLSRATLMEEVWKMPLETNTNIVDVYMKYLRDKIDGKGEEKLIHTVRGVGYVLRTSPSA